jgi:hypothetical protein
MEEKFSKTNDSQRNHNRPQDLIPNKMIAMTNLEVPSAWSNHLLSVIIKQYASHIWDEVLQQ